MKICLIADVHLYSNKLGITGEAFETRYYGDQRCLRESSAITDAAFEKIASSDVDCVLMAGDMSNDGEKWSHEEFKEKLVKLNEKKPCYVVYATHDWCCDNNPRRFEGDREYNDVEIMSPTDLRKFYYDFGENRAYSIHINEIGACSYAVKLADGVRLIALNDDKDGNGCSGYDKEHLDWILSQVADAKAIGEKVIVMEHHLVMPNVPLVSNGMCIGKHDERAEKLASAGVDLVIVGHSHFQRVSHYTAKNGNKMTQINVGSLTGYASPIVTLNIDENGCEMSVENLDKFVYEGKEYDLKFMRDHLEGLVRRILESARNNKAEFIKIVCGHGMKEKTASKVYLLAHLFANLIMTITVGKAARLINCLMVCYGKKGLQKKDYEPVKDDNLLDHIMDIFVGLFDGRRKAKDKNDPIYLVCDKLTDMIFTYVHRLPINKEKIDRTLTKIKGLVMDLVYPEISNIDGKIW